MPTYNNQSVKQNAISNALKELNETTLRRVIKNSGPPGCPGPAKVLTDYEEQQLILFTKIIDLTPLKKVDQVSQGKSQEHISVCPTISAARTYISLLIIYKGKCMIPGLLNGALAGSVMGFTDSRYMKECLFQKYIKHFIRSIPPTRPVLLILDSHKSHVSYACVNLCFNNNILLYALPPHTTHILQPAEIPFAHLKQAYSKSCEQLCFNNNGELVTKHTFAKVLGPVYIKTYTPIAICNAFKATGIWPFNPNAISPDHLDPSLATEQFDVSAMQPSTPILYLQPSTSTSLPSQAFSNLDPNLILTYTKKRLLKAEIKLLNLRIDQLEAELKVTKDELETFKNPNIFLLRLVLKYSLPHTLQSVKDPVQALLKNVEEEAERKANKIKQKKEAAVQKRIARVQKKEELDHEKAERQRIRGEKKKN
ncbi:16113_t:CDS:2 [Cetraspora pellucida]|uniref:16113_t:CDS:1 n=1 Tax=Cetraspora pellucida TaxID=1433469 RepID=A0A9N9EQ57_9GLOM|nr:16113_t:CDS:2 [Cetraspora pellucida]